jgi:hypothetical protein
MARYEEQWQKRVRWSRHALDALLDRKIDRREADRTLTNPELVALADPPRVAYMRRYHDEALGQEMLIRLVVEETSTERVVITASKTSRIPKYLGEQST